MTQSRERKLPAALFSAVFFPGGETAPDVALGLVQVEKLLDLFVQGRVDPGQALLQVLVDCGFGDTELGRGGAYSTAVLYHVHSQPADPIVYVLHDVIPPTLCPDEKAYVYALMDMHKNGPGTAASLGIFCRKE